MHRSDRGFKFFIFIVEVGSHANPGLGAIVNQDVPFEQFAADLLGVGHVDRNRAAAVLRVAWGIHAPSLFQRQVDQVRSLSF